MAKIPTKTISFPDEYAEEFNYLEKMKNASEYVRELVRKDRLAKESDPELLAKQVEELLLKMEELKQKNKTT